MFAVYYLQFPTHHITYSYLHIILLTVCHLQSVIYSYLNIALLTRAENMVLTTSEDGAIRVFHSGIKLHPFLKEINTFDAMNATIDQISADCKQAASLSVSSQYVQ